MKHYEAIGFLSSKMLKVQYGLAVDKTQSKRFYKVKLFRMLEDKKQF
jgi:hypothetical protein